MAIFGSKRDAAFLAGINGEIMNSIIDTEIEFFKLVIEQSAPNLYGESTSKSYYDSIIIPCLITKDEKQASMDDYGKDYSRTLQFGVSRDTLVKIGFVPEEGDIVFWDNEYYELDNVDHNQYLAGKNPATWPNGDSHGYNVSYVCDAHATRQTPLGIKNTRFGGTTNDQAYKGH